SNPAQPPANKELIERHKALAKVAQQHWENRWDDFLKGKTTVEFALPWSVKWLNAELRLTEKKSERIALYEAHLERMKTMEAINKAKFDAGALAVTQYHPIVYYRIEAEIWLDESKGTK